MTHLPGRVIVLGCGSVAQAVVPLLVRDLGLEPRRVTIHALERLGFAGGERAELTVRVRASKGTYVRVLAEDIGRVLGCGAHLAALRRIRVGPLSVADAVEPAAVEALDEPARDRLLAPADALVGSLPEGRLKPGQEQAILHGQAVPAVSGQVGFCRIYDAAGAFLGLGEKGGDGRLHPRRLMRSDPPENLAKHPDSQ